MIWPHTFEERLAAWYDLRCRAARQDLTSALLDINDWWWQAPMVNHSLNWKNTDQWPDPWHLLSQSGFCELARALGMLYTVLMCDLDGVDAIELIETTDNNLVRINQGKYILNWSPRIIVNIQSPETLTRSIDSQAFRRFIR